MFKKILIANRGEIACRVIKTARRLGIRTVAIYSDADRNALHVTMADEAEAIGPAPARESYLHIERVIDAAKKTGAEAIHPGYGFLSENAEFCLACKKNNIVFIGPPAGAIAAMGSKSAAKRIMENSRVPLVPGYHGDDQNSATLRQAANEIGYPVLLKATMGGGGKGMREVACAAEFDQALAAAKREAMNSFGDDRMLIEKYITRPCHVEIQVFCDKHGNAVYLVERDCSVQRRHQKIIEEAPAPGMTPALRKKMGEVAIKVTQAINYEGAGTVEFLLDETGAFYFMEMNTRLQVEHPVTEMITGQDLVEWQLRVACGEKLPLTQTQIRIRGHAFEARIYAEDPNSDFLPVTGKLSLLQPPEENEHVRVDTGVRQGDEVTLYYDPMIAKLIVWDEDRYSALQRLRQALSEYRIGGMKTNIDFLYNLTTCEAFAHADIDTSFIARHRDKFFPGSEDDIAEGLVLGALYITLMQAQRAQSSSAAAIDSTSPWNLTHAWRLNEPCMQQFNLVAAGHHYAVAVEGVDNGATASYRITAAGKTVQARGDLGGRNTHEMHADIDGQRSHIIVAQHDGIYSLYTQRGALQFHVARNSWSDAETIRDEGALIAPMNGIIVTLLAKTGDRLKKGDALLVMEAMKMEHTIRAPQDGRVIEFHYAAGELVAGGAELLIFDEDKK